MIPEILEAQVEISCKELRMPGLRHHFRNLVREAETHHAHIILFEGESYRFRESLAAKSQEVTA